MGKTGCPVCLKPYGAGHWSVVDCPQIKSEVKVELIPDVPELPAPEGSLTSESGSLTSSESRLTGSLTKQQRYRQAHPDWYRTYQREYMRRRRTQ